MDKLKKRRLGKTNIKVYPIGFGGISIQRISKEEAKKVINKAIDEGVNFFDSAKGYTCSEEYIGYATKERRDEVVLATKSMASDFHLMNNDIISSLENFQTSYIDLYQCHNIKSINAFMDLRQKGVLQALIEAKAKGLIHHIGITSHSCDFLKWLLNSEYISIFSTIQFPYNFLEDDAKELFKIAKTKDIGCIAMKPLGGGQIDDAKVALKYLLRDENLSLAIPGMASIEEVTMNLSITSLDISEVEKEYIKSLRKETEKDFCHRCGYCLPCTKGIDIPTMFTLERYYTKYNLQDWAKERYFKASVLPSACIDCAMCLAHCPYSLDIPQKLKKVVQLFERKD